MNLVAALLVGVLTLVSHLRWLRVAQREHYEAGRLVAMAGLWMRTTPVDAVLAALVVALGVAGVVWPLVGVAAALAWLAWPIGLALASRSSRLVFTDRVKRLTAIVVVLHLVVAVVVSLVGAAALLPLLVVPVAEAALLVSGPVERSMGKRFQAAAAERIRQVRPRVVAITGSYGKTSTKNYAAHLMAGSVSVLASPASFNNAMGLSRAVNDRLEPGTDVFVAEMGTYGPGEIAALCELFEPEVSAIVTIGEAHLERMKSRATIVRAKSEILPRARTIVLNIDVPELAALADEYAATKRVIRCSTEGAPGADVEVRGTGTDWELVLSGQVHPIELPDDVGHPVNVAIAVGLSIAVGVPEAKILERVGSVPSVPHRAEVSRLANDVVVIDDTYNSNPDGSAQAIARARQLVAPGGTVWTVTPGMVELGTAQRERNVALAASATADATMQLCVVGRTNRAALLAGASGAPGTVRTFGSRTSAAEHVMAHVQPGDVVLYENDLPDHYP